MPTDGPDEYAANSEQKIREAELFAENAHQGQVDKLGVPYIQHPRAVARMVRQAHPGSPRAEVVALLHDVIEDCDVPRSLIVEMFGETVAEAVVAISRVSGEAPAEYYERVRNNPLALIVKEADIAHNTSPERLDRLDEAVRIRLVKKYAKARTALGIS